MARCSARGISCRGHLSPPLPAARLPPRSFSATQADVALVAAIGKCPSADKFPHLARYYNHINALTASAKAS